MAIYIYKFSVFGITAATKRAEGGYLEESKAAGKVPDPTGSRPMKGDQLLGGAKSSAGKFQKRCSAHSAPILLDCKVPEVVLIRHRRTESTASNKL